MYGAILGDMIGAPYEFNRGDKTKDFPLFSRGSRFTDDSVMTVAVAEALLDTMGKTDDEIKKTLVDSMQKWGKKYPRAGYGGMFKQWLHTKDPKPYGSYGNGSAMRVSSVGNLFDTIEKTRHIARLTAEVTHNHPEGIKGAEAVAAAEFLARTGSTKEEIKKYITENFGYDLSRTCDEIRPTYHHVESCQETVPEAITAFLEGGDLEDVIRTAVSLGGDTDTLACIAGGIAEAFYGVSDELKLECRNRLTKDMLAVVDRFEQYKAKTAQPNYMFLDGNEIIEEAIDKYHAETNKENLIAVLDSIRTRMHADGHFIIPVIVDENNENNFAFRVVQTNDGKLWNAVFTSHTELEKGEPSRIISNFIDSTIKFVLESEAEGLIINPWGHSFMLAKNLIEAIIKADGDAEYSVPDVEITQELLEDGSFLKKAVEICSRNRTQLNLIKLMRILRDSWVWIPCNAVFSDSDHNAITKTVMETIDNNNIEILKDKTFTTQDNIRLIPDILQSEGELFFPIFTSDKEMGEYGDGFSKVARPFLEAANLARNNEKNVKGIVINAFSEPFEIPVELFDIIAEMPSGIETEDKN